MKILLILSFLSLSVFAHERNFKTRADLFATALKTSPLTTHPWPFPLLSIGHNMQSFQNYDGSPYWHDGLDIRSEQDQPIYAAAGGKVVNIENYIRGNALYWEVAILDAQGFVWKYHHVAKESIAVKNGELVKEGSLIGNVVRWPISTFGERYHHLHLLVVAKDGQYINPLLLMNALEDTSSPVISTIGIAKNHKPQIGETKVKGPHALFVEASDLILHQKFILPPHKISYRLDGLEEVVVWEFTHLPSKTNDTDFINDFYMTGTCGNYQCRKFYINLFFSPENPRLQKTLTTGAHSVEVNVEDILGNRASKQFQWDVL